MRAAEKCKIKLASYSFIYLAKFALFANLKIKLNQDEGGANNQNNQFNLYANLWTCSISSYVNFENRACFWLAFLQTCECGSSFCYKILICNL